ncbi:Receptor protein kinase TMK1 [Camellia lanceoleosa]|uniref:Receptor protein kinase TMK1 n=1 Tax=Camellia lanceoleosa TaxID=1840588 RepID=A0ACC0IDH3_9ERIC|nr:Receptor protein kinase TMK1 [Camellia lanceoleosa]
MQALKQSINPPSSLGWTDSNPYKWQNVGCSSDNRVTRIQIGHQKLKGSLPPSLASLTFLQRLEFMSNQLTGPVPSLTNNLLQGPTPKFHSLVAVDMTIGTNSFCLSDPGVGCNSRVNTLLTIVQSVGYPTVFADSWKGNDFCVQ